MFYNFSAPKAITKRRRVNRACGRCRVQRIRCDTNTPCSQCVDQGILCSRLSASETSNRRELRKNEQELRHARRKSPNNEGLDTHQSHAEISRQQLSESGYQLDSTLDFVTRINAFCSQVLQSSSWTDSHEDDPGPYRSPFCPGEVEVGSAQCDISTSQLKSLFWVFQTRIHPQIPIVSQEDLRISNSSNETETPNRRLCRMQSSHTPCNTSSILVCTPGSWDSNGSNSIPESTGQGLSECLTSSDAGHTALNKPSSQLHPS